MKLLTRKKQQGMATVLMSVLMGVAITATSVAILYSIKDNQKRQQATQAQTHSQGAAWFVVDIAKKIIEQKNKEELIAWATLTLNDEALPAYNSSDDHEDIDFSINWLSVEGPNAVGKFIVESQVYAKDVGADASSTLKITFEAKPTFERVYISNPYDATFGASVDLSGDINFNVVDGGRFIVKGDITGSGSIGGTGSDDARLAELAATGGIFYGSAIHADVVRSNDFIKLTAGAGGGNLESGGPVELSGDVRVGSIKANGYVSISGGSSGRVDSGQYIYATSDYSTVPSSATDLLDSDLEHHLRAGHLTLDGSTDISEITKPDTVTENKWQSLHQPDLKVGDIKIHNSNTENLKARGEIVLDTYGHVADVKSLVKVTCINAESLGNVYTPDFTRTCGKGNIQSGNAQVTAPTPVTEVSLDPPAVDAWAYRDDANYIFELRANGNNDDDDGLSFEPVMKIRDIENQTNRTVALSSDEIRELFCVSTSNHCVEYEAATNLWKISAEIAHGVLWFDGDLSTSGIKYNSLVATGDITTTGDTDIYAVNYDGLTDSGTVQSPEFAKNVCTEQVRSPAKEGETATINVPSNLCQEDGYHEVYAGFFALVAGEIDPQTGEHKGGIIDFTAGSEIFGNTIAGDLVRTSGATIIRGKVSAAGKVTPEGQNKIGAQTDIRTADMPEGMDAPILNSDEDGPSGPTEVALKWVKYL